MYLYADCGTLNSSGVFRFNFPAMIPLWNIPVALATGNTLILKPSERDPGASLMLAELALKAGFPKGVLQVVHGGKDVVKYLCEEERVKAITFVGGGAAGKAIWDMGTNKGKRVQVSLGQRRDDSIVQSLMVNGGTGQSRGEEPRHPHA